MTGRKFSLLLLHFLCIYWLNAEPIVNITQGILKGTIQESRNGRKYSAFLGIPYAEPPIGNLRFKTPVPAKNWNGVKVADAYGSVCPQENNGTIIGNENCLYLNIYSPLPEHNLQTSSELKNRTMLPVMLWFHGGAFYYGGSNIYQAEYLLDKDVVLVTINYRLGILGFLSTGDSVSPGNFGMKDQVLAMKWVQKNIAAFGGNPQKVTIFGQSAGGASVALHVLSKASNGLFQQYIIQSGSPLSSWVYQNRSKFKNYSQKIAALLQCPFDNSEHLVDCLRNKSVENLMKVLKSLNVVSEYDKLKWTATDEPEADDAFLTNSPKKLIETNQMKDLPFMTGQTTDEMKSYTIGYWNMLGHNSTKLITDTIISNIAGYYLKHENVSSFVSAIQRYYFNDSLYNLSKDEFIECSTRFASDGFLLYPEVRMLEMFVPKMKNRAYFYSFGYRGSSSNTCIWAGDNRNHGVSHTDELIYLFSNFLVLSGGPKVNTTKTDEYMVDLMVDLWTSFATNGKPTSKKLLNPGLWAPYTVEKPNYLQIGDINNNTDPTVTLSDNYYTSRMNFWKEHAPI